MATKTVYAQPQPVTPRLPRSELSGPLNGPKAPPTPEPADPSLESLSDSQIRMAASGLVAQARLDRLVATSVDTPEAGTPDPADRAERRRTRPYRHLQWHSKLTALFTVDWSRLYGRDTETTPAPSDEEPSHRDGA